MSSRVREFLIGDTIEFTWVHSGVSVDNLHLAVLAEDGTVVHSETMANSGDGHYYTFYTLVETTGYFCAKMQGEIAGYPYVRPITFKAVECGVH